MREITASELSKILKDHKKWIKTNHAEGRRADLSDADLSGAKLRGANLENADLTQVKNLSIKQLSEVRTLYKAKSDPELKKQVEDRYPHLLKKPKS